ncbi:MAG: class I SAM-dependent methyltransferase, partial [Proteobacteria bacterium]|nr:class I SAM-dependent methyltransferase [Pseudomonadota bacterium]
MYENDLGLLRCPASGAALNIARIDATADDGEILEGELASGGGGHPYPITNGIPRFVERSSYNES